MVWARDKIEWPNQSDIKGNSQRQDEKEMDWQHCGVGRQIIRRDSSNGTQPAGVERPDEEVCHDAPLRLFAEQRDQGKAKQHGSYHVDLRRKSPPYAMSGAKGPRQGKAKKQKHWSIHPLTPNLLVHREQFVCYGKTVQQRVQIHSCMISNQVAY